MYDPYNYVSGDRSVGGGEPEIIDERTSEVSMYQPIGPKTAASVLIRKGSRISPQMRNVPLDIPPKIGPEILNPKK